MFQNLQRTAAITLAGAFVAGAANAAEVAVSSDITTATVWTANNTYNLTTQIYVKPGATLTIEAGTIIASDTGMGGSLAVEKGAQIHAMGTADNPVIFTSKADMATWTGGDPKTGTWREAATEWGNLTIMGCAYISENAVAGNVPTCDANNQAIMEGLVAPSGGPDPRLYGGGDDDDDSGTLNYVSLRYGGAVIAVADELNGLSLGGIGRGTDIHHVEIMNNVDDGIEIWGGTVNLKYVSIWNVGDDSFDLDQGWRGKAQFGLIVQGWSQDASQGSGVGDNMFEMDGAEASSWQPVTTGVIYNFTAIGQPLDGDYATDFKDNVRMQFRNCIFMDNGDDLVHDGGDPNFAACWTTASGVGVAPALNACANPNARYTAQVDGNLCEITDSVIYNSADNTTATAVGVFDPANNNVSAASLPIRSITRAATVVKGGIKQMQMVTKLDPRAANDALTSVGTAPNDGFFCQANYRGAFAANENWLCGWTAADAFGFIETPGSTSSYNGLGVNFAGFTSTDAPNVGETWDSSVVLTPGAVASVVAFGAGGILPPGVILSYGELHILPPFSPLDVSFGTHSLPVPNDCNLVGIQGRFQGGTWGPGTGVVLQNSIDIVLGS